MNKILSFYERNKKAIVLFSTLMFFTLFLLPVFTTKRIKINQSYTSKQDVALYIMKYNELPKNYVTKYGLDYIRNHNLKKDGLVMGGDTHINTDELSVYGVKQNASLKECDIAESGYDISGNRGTERLVYTRNSKHIRVFYTQDHYHTFTELSIFQLQLTRNIFWILFACYCILFTSFYIGITVLKKKYSSGDPLRENEKD